MALGDMRSPSDTRIVQMMPDSEDPPRLFEAISAQLEKMLAMAEEQRQLPAPLLEPLRLQAELVRQAGQRQRTFEGRLEEWMRQAAEAGEALQRAPETFRKQAAAFEAASGAFADAARMLTQHADLIETTVSALSPAGPRTRA